MKFTFAVTPFVVEGDIHEQGNQKLIPLSKEKAEILRIGVNQGLIDVALHGYSHQSHQATDYSELSGLDYEQQFGLILDAKKFLEKLIGTPVNIFAPPWNSYDENTLSALEDIGFSILTAGRDGPAKQNSRLKFIPSTCSLKRLLNAVKEARKSKIITRPIIVVLLHEFEFLDINPTRGLVSFEEFSTYISLLSSQKDIRILSIGQLATVVKGLGAKRFLSMKNTRSALYQ